LKKLRLRSESLGELLYHVRQFADAAVQQHQWASFNRGKELPDHARRKGDLRAMKKGLTPAIRRIKRESPGGFRRLRAFAGRQLEEIQLAEKDGNRWPPNKAKAKLRRLLEDLEVVLNSPTLRSMAGADVTIDRFAAGLSARLAQPSQAAKLTTMRREALNAIGHLEAPWQLVADLVWLASGKSIEISADTLRKDFAEL
jgi:hypothetical protein